MNDNVELLDAKKRVEAILLGNTGSFAGVGAKNKDDTVTVYLRKKDEYSIKRARELLGTNKANGHEIEYLESGHISALGCGCNSLSSQNQPQNIKESSLNNLTIPTTISRTSYSRPVYGGMSIGHHDITAGTAGTVVYDAITNDRYILSNNHVLANSSMIGEVNAIVGDQICSPGPADTGNMCQYGIGGLNRFVPFNRNELNFVDCAIMKPSIDTDISDSILDVGVTNGWESATEGMMVKKSGRTSGYTENTVIDTNATMEVDYNGTILRFGNCIVTGMCGIGGDSGAVLLNRSNNNAVGLLFAGSDTITIFNKIEYVLDALQVKMTSNGTLPTQPIAPTSITSEQVNFLGGAAIMALAVGGIYEYITKRH